MSKAEWFRRTTGTDADRKDFSARLKRRRGASRKAQYLRLQALHLAEARHHEGAIEIVQPCSVSEILPTYERTHGSTSGGSSLKSN
jgi:hypothetical protein